LLFTVIIVEHVDVAVQTCCVRPNV